MRQSGRTYRLSLLLLGRRRRSEPARFPDGGRRPRWRICAERSGSDMRTRRREEEEEQQQEGRCLETKLIHASVKRLFLPLNKWTFCVLASGFPHFRSAMAAALNTKCGRGLNFKRTGLCKWVYVRRRGIEIWRFFLQSAPWWPRRETEPHYQTTKPSMNKERGVFLVMAEHCSVL